MAKKIIFLVVSLLILAIVYMITLSSIILERKNELLLDAITEGVTKEDYTEYVKFSTELYEEIDLSSATIDTNYHYQMFHTVESNSKGLFQGFILFIGSKNDVSMADKKTDSNDKTRLLIESTEVVYDSNLDSVYEDYAISYGLKERQVYYYYVKIESFGSRSITAYDYHGNEILNIEVSFSDLPIDPETDKKESLDMIKLLGYSQSFTLDEINRKVNINSRLWQVYLITGAFLIMDIMIGKFLIFRKK